MDNFVSPFKMVRVGLTDAEEKTRYDSQKIEINKRISRLNSLAREKSKSGNCFLCNKECTSFCNSHSIPQFVLQRISEKGKLQVSLQGEIPTLGNDTGIRKAGTFQLICEDCDNTTFQEYENPLSYEQTPSQKMLAQMALKDYLLLISKRNIECELYDILIEKFPEYKAVAEEKRDIGLQDLLEYKSGVTYATKALKNTYEKSYHICYFKILDYVVPYATQSAIAMVSDFEDIVINNIYNFDEDYSMKEIHFAIFPLKTTSVILLFIENGEKRYRNFYRKLNKLTEEDQLAVINYIVFSYTENVYINSNTYGLIKENSDFMDICRKTTDYTTSIHFALESPISTAVHEFSLSNRHKIPNLLSREYALDNN